MSAELELLYLLEKLHLLNSRLDVLTERAKINSQIAEIRQRVRELSMIPTINKQVAETLSRLSRIKSREELEKAIEETENVTSSLKAIIQSPRVEEFLAALKIMLTSVELQLLPDGENWLRKSLKDANATFFDQIIETTNIVVDKEIKVIILKDQLKKWLSQKIAEVTNLKESKEALINWVDEIESGIDSNLSLEGLLSEVKDAEASFPETSGLIKYLHQICLRELEKGFGNKIKDVSRYWKENEKIIKEIWFSTKTRLTTINYLMKQLCEGERDLMRKYIKQSKRNLKNFIDFIDDFSEKVHSILELKKTNIIAQINSIKEVKLTDEQLIKLKKELKQLQKNLPDVKSFPTIKLYLQSLESFHKTYAIWEKEGLAKLIQEVKKEAESWRGVCIKQGLDVFERSISKIMINLSSEILIGELTSRHTELLSLYEKIKGELGKKGDPELLEAIVRLLATKSPVTLSDVEEEVSEIRPNVTREDILKGLADLESKKLVTVEIKT